MKINLEDIKNIELCYENCEVDTIHNSNLLGVSIPRKSKSAHSHKEKPSYNIKSFEIAIKNSDYNYVLRRDLAQLTINYMDGSFEHFFVVWGKKDCSWDVSSLQKVHKKDNLMSLTSNCETQFLSE